MKKEVSCRALGLYFDLAKKRNISPQTLCAGVTYPLSHLHNKHERVEWDVYCKITSNLRPFLTEAEFEALGIDSMKSVSFFPGAIALAKLLFDCADLYWWLTGMRGPGPQIFTCINSMTRQVGRSHLTVTLQLAPDYQYCREFLLISKGSFVAMSTLIGLEPAQVEMREIDRGAFYDVFYPEGGGSLSWLRRAVTWPFAARIVARELKETNEALHERYAQLEQANIQVQRQAAQLREEYSVRQLMQQEFSRMLIEQQEAERKHLASELHDGLGQNLLVVKNELQQFLSEQKGPQDDLNRVVTLVQESVESVREISSNLHPHHIERLGFCAAIEAMTENISHSAGFRIACSCDKLEHQLPKEIEIHLYRIIQEGLSNIVRHASAHNARVEVQKNPKSIEVIISDDGCGFDIREFEGGQLPGQSIDPGRGFGLASMSERARIIGGTLTMESSTASGTTIRLTLPLS